MFSLAANAATKTITNTSASQSPRILVAYFSMQDGNTGDVAELCRGCTVDTDGWSSWGGGRQRGIAKWIERKLSGYKQ